MLTRIGTEKTTGIWDSIRSAITGDSAQEAAERGRQTAQDAEEAARGRGAQLPLGIGAIAAGGRLSPEAEQIYQEALARIAAEDALAAPAEQEFADYWGGRGEAWEAQAAANPGPVPDGWDAPLPELDDEEINRIDADRKRAEQEAIEDERQPGGPLWDDEHGRPYDDATCARLINDARYPEPAAGPEWSGPALEANAESDAVVGYDCYALRDAEDGRAEPAAELEAGS